jgi:hypothetical protein
MMIDMDARTRAAFAATALLLHAGSLHAQEVIPVPPGQDVIIPVRKGATVPDDGQLFDNATALRWANYIVQYKNLVVTNKELDQKVCAADTSLAATKLELMQKQYDTVTKDLQDKLTKSQEAQANPPWYHTTTFGVIVGIVGTLALGGVTAALVGSVK